MSYFLVINHESYDSSTVFGIFKLFEDAVRCAKRCDDHSGLYVPIIEEWDGAHHIQDHTF